MDTVAVSGEKRSLKGVPEVAVVININRVAQNNLLRRAVKDLGLTDPGTNKAIKTVREFCEFQGIRYYGAVSDLLHFRATPFVAKGTRKGGYSRICKKLADKLGFHPSEIFPRGLYKRMMNHVPRNEEPVVVEMSSRRFRDIEDIPCRCLGCTPEEDEPTSQCYKRELLEIVEWLLEDEPPRYWEVIRLRFGIGCKNPMLLEEIGKHLHCTCEAVRQTESRALKVLREGLQGFGFEPKNRSVIA